MKSIKLTALICFFAYAGKCQQNDSIELTKTGDTVFLKVEKEAGFPGGIGSWTKYLERNLDFKAAEKKATIGCYTVIVEFIVARDGTLSNARAVANPEGCPNCAAEAVRVTVKGPKWIPAVFNGRTVIQKRRQPITFLFQDQ